MDDVIERYENWGDKVIAFLSKGDYQNAIKLAEVSLQGHEKINQSLISGLYAKFQEDNTSAADTVLRVICDFGPTDTTFIDLIQVFKKNCSSFSSDVFHLTSELYLSLLSRECDTNDLYLEWCLHSILSYVEDVASRPSISAGAVEHTVIYFLKEAIRLDVIKTDKSACHFITFILNLLLSMKTPMTGVILTQLIAQIIGDPFIIINIYLSRLRGKTRSGCGYFAKSVSYKSLAIFVFNVVHEQLLHVYSKMYIFQKCLPFATVLIDEEDEELTTKGVTLLDHILCDPLSITDLTEAVEQILLKLNYIMIYATDKSLRISSLRCFENFLELSDLKAKYHIFLRFESPASHSGTRALLISKIKKTVEFCHRSPNDVGCKYFTGKRLFDLLNLHCTLLNGTKSEIATEAEPILASLNFLFYLLAKRDDSLSENRFSHMKINFLDSLKVLIPKTLENIQKSLMEVDLNVEQVEMLTNLNVPELSRNDKVNTIICARHSIELIQMTLDRLNEVIPVHWI